MDPMTLALLANIGIQGLGPLFNSKENVNINPYTEQIMQDFYRQLAEAKSQYEAQIAQGNRATQEMSGTANQMGNIANEAKNLEGPGANEWYDQWLQNVPGYQEIAKNLAESSTQNLGRSVDEQVALDTQRAMTEAMNQFAGQNAYSGAAQAALGQAVAQPMANARVQMNANKAGIESNAFNQMAGQGQGLSFQGKQNEFTNALQTLMSALEGYGQKAGVQAQQAGNYLQGAGIAGNMVSGLNSSLGQMGTPLMQTQDTNPFMANLMTGANNAFDIYTNPQYGLVGPRMTKPAPTTAPNYKAIPTYGNAYEQYLVY